MRRFLIVFFALLATVSVSAQDRVPTVGIMPFTATGISNDELVTIENLIQSYVSEIKTFKLISIADRDKILSEVAFSVSAGDASMLQAGTLLSANFLLSGSIGQLEDAKTLTLEVIAVKTGEKKSLTSIHKSMKDLALEARIQVLKLFEVDQDTVTVSELPRATGPDLTEVRLIGTWKGDKGIEMVRVYAKGKAIAIMSAGVQMELHYSITKQTVTFVQSSPNTERFYHPVPYPVAKQLVSIAIPMEWEFQLYEGDSVLRGKKKATSVRHEHNQILETKNTERPAEWTRTR